MNFNIIAHDESLYLLTLLNYIDLVESVFLIIKF